MPAPFADQYFEIPGRDHEVTLSVRTVPREVSYVHTITAISRHSANILRHDPEAQELTGWFAKRDRTFTFPELCEYLSESSVVLLQQLRVELDFPSDQHVRDRLVEALTMSRGLSNSVFGRTNPLARTRESASSAACLPMAVLSWSMDVRGTRRKSE